MKVSFLSSSSSSRGSSRESGDNNKGIVIMTSFHSWFTFTGLVVLGTVTTAVCGYFAVHYTRKRIRSRWLRDEESRELQEEEAILNEDDDDDDDDDDSSQKSSSRRKKNKIKREPSPRQPLFNIIEHFKSLELNAQSTILEANRRRTTSYYEKARQAHEQSLVLGVPSYSKLLQKRREEVKRLQFYFIQGKKSLRTVIVMCDAPTQQLLTEARQRILSPLHYEWDIYTRGAWIPPMNVIPKHDMHVTICVPYWWHSLRNNNAELTQAMAQRLRHALIVDFHHPFCIELERIVLLGGKTLVALWRTVGERTVIDRETQTEIKLVDRHSLEIDPMVRLRRQIVECFTKEREEHKIKPLTHHHLRHRHSLDFGDNSVKTKGTTASPVSSTELHPSGRPLPDHSSVMTRSNSLPKLAPVVPKPSLIKKSDRRHTIELKTPGLGSGDGFIHTTLCRLPLDCLSTDDVELEPVHRLCREATATYAGHRMLVHKFRFLETTGEGGDSNPCVGPLFDETIEAPTRTVVDTRGHVHSVLTPAMHMGMPMEERNALTTGAVKQNMAGGGGVESLFEAQR
mmetsp:Transcript_2166/g.3998  ORF Transcript_2166/g.3998 Transcript_2166/m.3998 type:complete len:569 (+) Transcript_2166:2728-4434(+)